MTSMLILGAGGHAKVVAETALASCLTSSVAFLDDRCSGPEKLSTILGWPVLGPLAQALDPNTSEQYSTAVVAIGHSLTRLRWINNLHIAGYNLPILIHPTAWVSPSAQIGRGSVVFAQAAVQAQVSIGAGNIINTGSIIDHDTHVDDGVHICPRASLAGQVRVGPGSWIGIGASVIQSICIGSDVTVGAGAAVVSDLPDGVTACGVPARILSKS